MNDVNAKVDVNAAAEFDLSDVHQLNGANLAYVEQLPEDELLQRMREITLPNFGDASLLLKAQEILREFGIVVFSEVVDAETCKIAEQSIEAMCAKYASSDESWFEDEKVLFQVGSAKLKGFYKLSNYGKTVVTIRQGQDQGMVDIFNCDFALAASLGPLRVLFENEYLLKVIGSDELRPHNLNAYINRAITATRGFHVDSYAEHLKAFVYITDVTALEDGPYTYVKRSHRDSPFRRANNSLCGELTPATETPIVDPLAITPILARRGSLVISDQAGSHRGWPQALGHRRMAAVMKYAK